jgi:hypothetical protein
VTADDVDGIGLYTHKETDSFHRERERRTGVLLSCGRGALVQRYRITGMRSTRRIPIKPLSADS